MNAKAIGIIIVLAVVVVVAGVGAAFVTGVAPDIGGDDGANEETYENTVVYDGGDGESGGSSGGSSGDAKESGGSSGGEQLPPFSFRVKKISECGDTCRTVTAGITNNRDESTEVTVRSVIYTDGDEIWEGESDLGTLAPGETKTDSKRVELGYLDAAKVKQNGGEILVKTYVVTDEAVYVFKERRDVA